MTIQGNKGHKDDESDEFIPGMLRVRCQGEIQVELLGHPPTG